MHLLNDKPNLQCEGVRLTIGRPTEQGRGNTRLCILQRFTDRWHPYFMRKYMSGYRLFNAIKHRMYFE